jgi:hypothetical protein
MDILAHAAYGATLCSRTGLGGGRTGGARWRGRFDWTIWVAVAFSLLPDVASIGVGFARMWLQGAGPSFHALPPYVFVLYRLTHNLIVAGLCVLLLRLVARPLALPALAWPVHVLADALLHDHGRWQSPLLYPLADWRLAGVNWWEHREVFLLYWGLLPLLWLTLHWWRRARLRAV